MKLSLIALALAAVLPLSAQATELKYLFVEGSYIRTDFVDENFDGFAVKGSVPLGQHFYGTLSYREVEDNSDFDINLDETLLNIGYRHGLNDRADFIAEVGYVSVGVNAFDITSQHSDGYRVGVGFRGLMTPKFEGEIKGYYTDIEDFGDAEFGVSIGAVYHFNQTWGITGSFDTTDLVGENFQTWGLGVRASF